MPLVTLNRPAAVLRRFFAVPSERIAADLAAAPGRRRALALSVARHLAEHVRRPGAMRPGRAAAFLHRLVLLAASLRDAPGVPEAVAVRFAALGAGAVAGAAAEVAATRGEAGAIGRALAALLEDTGWGAELLELGIEPPAGYDELAARRDELLERVEGVVAGCVLRRYGLDDFADRFDRDPSAFWAAAEEGSRMIGRGEVDAVLAR